MVTIPESVTVGERKYDVTVIGSYAFEGCDNLKKIVLPESLDEIRSYAVSNCSALTEVVIPDGVSSIGDYGFYNCSRLTIYVPMSQQEARQEWGNRWQSGCDVSYNYSE